MKQFPPLSKLTEADRHEMSQVGYSFIYDPETGRCERFMPRPDPVRALWLIDGLMSEVICLTKS